MRNAHRQLNDGSVPARLHIWHPALYSNFVPFLGVTGYPPPLSMVLEWMPNGGSKSSQDSKRICCSLYYVTPIIVFYCAV